MAAQRPHLMRPSTARLQMDKDLDALSEKYTKLIEAWAHRVLDDSKKYRAFNASMGAVCFYDKHGPVDDEKLTALARELYEFACRFTDNFGSPGVYVSKDAIGGAC